MRNLILFGQAVSLLSCFFRINQCTIKKTKMFRGEFMVIHAVIFSVVSIFFSVEAPDSERFQKPDEMVSGMSGNWNFFCDNINDGYDRLSGF